jgi:hypothetical protein
MHPEDTVKGQAFVILTTGAQRGLKVREYQSKICCHN